MNIRSYCEFKKGLFHFSRTCGLTKMIKLLIANGGCACELSDDVCRRQPLFRPAAAGPLSAARLLLSTRRQQTNACCPAVRYACSALLSDPAWTDYVLDGVSSADRYVRYAASRTAVETAWCLEGPQQIRLADGLVLAAVTACRVPEMTSAVGVIRRVLADNDDSRSRILAAARKPSCAENGVEPSAQCFAVVSDRHEIKRLLLDRMEDCRTVMATAALSDGNDDDMTAMRVEFMKLWKSALSSADAAARGQYYTDLPAFMDRLLYRTDTDPHVWLNTVRLLSASLNRPETNRELIAVAEEVATGVTRRRLLYFMCKTSRDFRAKVVLQETVLLTMRSLRVLTAGNGTAAGRTATRVVDCLDSYVKSSTLFATDVPFCRWLVRLMCDRDDVVVECLACTLAVADAVPATRPLFEPLESFAELLASVSFDPGVLLDYLISDENDFLPYALNVLKTAALDIRRFCRCCGPDTDRTIDLLIRLRLKILKLHDGNVFPYNITPIAKIIYRCEELYSQMH